MRLGTKTVAALLAAAASVATAASGATANAGPTTGPAANAGPAAKAKTRVHPEMTLISFHVPGTKGWRLSVSTEISGKAKRQKIGVEAHGPEDESVGYEGVHARVGADGTIAARLPGLGRIDVRFEQSHERAIEFIAPKNCTGDGPLVARRGLFRGTIEFHGERGYTEVARRSARGEILETPRQVCRDTERHIRPIGGGSAEPRRLHALVVGGPPDNHLRFTATSFPPGPAPSGQSSPTVYFDAYYTMHRNGIVVFARADAAGGSAKFSILEAPGAPTEATVEPPAPFAGSATFRLESPTTASWSGDLSVEVPILGKIDLTGPRFWSGLCTGTTCTETLPSGPGLGLLIFG